eukprot:jgi/Mesvir1/23051/Mv08168-RA.1
MAPITVKVKTITQGNSYEISIETSATVADLKAQVRDKANIPVEEQRLIYKGHVLKDSSTLESYGLQHEHVVHLVRNARPQGTPPSHASPGVRAAPSPAAASPSPASASQPAGRAAGAPPFGVGGMDPLGMGGIGGMGDLAQVQQQLMANPNLISDMMASPAMQAILNNPDLMRSLILNNPRLRSVMDSNPELSHILNDPALLRQTMEAARNPQLMREMMRNTDRAMSNIESHPEGFNMLRRMYENVQQPLLNTAAEELGSTAGGGPAENPFAALFAPPQGTAAATPPGTTAAPNTAPLPNPWAPSPAGGAARTTGGVAAAGGLPGGGLGADNPFGMGFLPGAGFGGLGGAGGLEGLGVDPVLMGEMLQQPAFQSMMQQFLSNPELMRQMMQSHPLLRQMADSNPMMASMMANPEMLRQLANPEVQQALATLQRTLGTHITPAATGGAAAQENLLAALLGGRAMGGAPGVPESNEPPETRFAAQLQQLRDMGFFDTQANIQALLASSGNVNLAVERLLSG